VIVVSALEGDGMSSDAIKLFVCDFNFSMDGVHPRPSWPQDWAFVDPREYFDWHMEFGNTAILCHAYTFSGYALYPTRLGPVAPEPGNMLLPSLYRMARDEGVPLWSYFCVGADHIMMALRPQWGVPGTHFMAPEGPWTDMLCDRIREVLSMYPVDWLLLDWFVYGSLESEGAPIGATPFAVEAYERITGEPLPEDPSRIGREEEILYKRSVLGEQFEGIRKAVRDSSSETKIVFNVPYREPAGALWQDHPMLRESDGLFSECTDDSVMEWLLSVRSPGQRVMTTIRGQAGEGLKGDPHLWRKWHGKGCDFMGYAFGTPPDFRPHRIYQEEVNLVRQAFKTMG
jgi:hypothetical protein